MAKEDLRADEPALKVVTSLIVQALVKEMKDGRSSIVKKWINSLYLMEKVIFMTF